MDDLTWALKSVVEAPNDNTSLFVGFTFVDYFTAFTQHPPPGTRYMYPDPSVALEPNVPKLHSDYEKFCLVLGFFDRTGEAGKEVRYRYVDNVGL